MIIIDRPLTPKETAEVDGLQVYHVPTTQESKSHNASHIYDWIDTIDKLGIKEQSPVQFFNWNGKSFWLHIRARLFNRLLEHAQFLDQISDLEHLLIEKLTIYTTAERAKYWKKWSTHSQLIYQEQSTPSSPPKSSNRKRFFNAFKGLFNKKLTPTNSVEYLFYSPSRNTLNIDGKLHDKTFQLLYDDLGDKALRIEYQILPHYIPTTTNPDFFNSPRKSPTIASDTALLSHILRKPWLGFEAILLLIRYNSRFCNYNSELKLEYRDEVWTQLINELISSFKMSIVQLLFFESLFSELMQRYQPKAVIATGESNGIGRAFVEAAKNHSIPTFGVQHGDLPPNNIDYRYSEEIAPNAKTDYFFYWGEESKVNLMKQALYTPDQLIPVGQLEFEQIKARITVNEEVEQFKKKAPYPVMLFASQPQQSSDSRTKTAYALASFCANNQLACVLKLHPAEQRDGLHQKAFDELGIGDRIIEVNDDIYNLIYSTDYTSTCYSTTAWEAMSMKKPVIIIDPLELDLLGLKDEGSIYYIGSATPMPFEQWKEKINRHVNHSYSLSYQKLGDREGSPSQKVLGFINSVINR